jgi:hypothetical protein
MTISPRMRHILRPRGLDWFSNVFTGIGVYNNECINRTRMTRMRRIIADKTKKIGVNPLYPRHPCSINPYTDRSLSEDELQG